MFVTAGNSALVHGGQPSLSAREFLKGFRAAAGVGLVYPSPIGRLEVRHVAQFRSKSEALGTLFVTEVFGLFQTIAF